MTVKGKTDTNSHPFERVNRSFFRSSSVRMPKKIRLKCSTNRSNGLHIRSKYISICLKYCDIRSNGSDIRLNGFQRFLHPHAN